MSGSVNKVTLIGNLARDPEFHSMNNGGKLANLRVITSESWRDKNTGERQERSQGHDVVIYNERLVEISEKYFRKGDKVYVEGSLVTRKYQDREGVDRWTTEVVLQKYRGELTNLTSRKDSGNQDESYNRHDDRDRGGYDRDTRSHDYDDRGQDYDDRGGRGERDDRDTRSYRDDRDDRDHRGGNGGGGGRRSGRAGDDVPF